MKVYVVEQGVYEDRKVVGVYATPEAAMEAHPLPRPQVTGVVVTTPGGWRHANDRYWDNGLDWADACGVTEWEVA